MNRAANGLFAFVVTLLAVGLSPALAASRPAPGGWTITARAERFVVDELRSSNIASAVRNSLVCLDWTEGGWAIGPDRRRIPLRAEYGISLFAKNGAPPNAILLPSRLFGRMCFVAKPEDARSSRRLIDYVDHDIVVR